MDKKGNKAARHLIAMIKIVAPNVALKVLDYYWTYQTVRLFTSLLYH